MLSNGSGGYGLHLNGAAHWQLTGFAVADAGKGIILDASNHVTIHDVEVSDVDDEAVHFRGNSSDNVIQNSFIHDTGRRQPQYGEAVYFGSAKSNWDNGEPDRSNRNQALDNRLGPNVTAEHVDIKEGTENGVVRGNSFRANDSDLAGASGYAIRVTNQPDCATPNVVYADNTVRNAGSGLTNIEPTG